MDLWVDLAAAWCGVTRHTVGASHDSCRLIDLSTAFPLQLDNHRRQHGESMKEFRPAAPVNFLAVVASCANEGGKRHLKRACDSPISSATQ